MTAKHLILSYWHSWQKLDFAEMRSYLADFVEIGGEQMPADAFVQSCAAGVRVGEVRLVDSVFGDDGGAIAYEGIDARSGAGVKVLEIVHVWCGKIVGVHGVLVANGRELRGELAA